MTIDAIRARHVQGQETCMSCAEEWPCDTATVLAALDEREHEVSEVHQQASEWLTRSSAAEAREARLREALVEAHEALRHATAHRAGLSSRPCSFCEAGRRLALASPEAEKFDPDLGEDSRQPYHSPEAETCVYGSEAAHKGGSDWCLTHGKERGEHASPEAET